MFAIAVELLTGAYRASHFADRDAPEWPPHPARLFSALVAAAAHPLDDGPPDATALDAPAREVLLWLESQPPPTITASPLSEISIRGAPSRRGVIYPVEHFVPVNDTSAHGWTRIEAAWAALDASPVDDTPRGNKALAKLRDALDKAVEREIAAPAVAKSTASVLAVLPVHRGKQARTYPTVVPADPLVTFSWPDVTLPPALFEPLVSLCRRVTRLGHSASLVSCRLSTADASATAPTWVPRADGDTVLRWVGSGQVPALEANHARLASAGVRSGVLPAVPTVYGPPEPATTAPRSVFSARPENWIVFERRSGERFSLRHTVPLMRALRAALLRAADTTWPASLCGHDAQGAPAPGHHLAFVPLPFVDHEHAHGGILGVAIVPPADLSTVDRAQLLDAVDALAWQTATAGPPGEPAITLRLYLGAAGEARFADRPADATTASTDPRTWLGPSTRWATVTPVVLGRFPGDLRSPNAAKAERAQREAIATLVESVVRSGLPPPVDVRLSHTPVVHGALHAGDVLPYTRGRGGPAMFHIHARFEFAKPVAGPVLVGAGRHLGMGLCRPLHASGGRP
ncbi:type I-U CRISPR-associated protein Csb2 [Myxococcota bacterium]|nr:type I-U CRISPR-associated protein Csb2 [Myxococcota bacterium]